VEEPTIALIAYLIAGGFILFFYHPSPSRRRDKSESPDRYRMDPFSYLNSPVRASERGKLNEDWRTWRSPDVPHRNFQQDFNRIDDILVNLRQKDKGKGPANISDEIEVGDEQITFTCPLSLGPIKLPGRGRNCAHAQCSDIEVELVYINFSSRSFLAQQTMIILLAYVAIGKSMR
jgi:hypothetical protein